MIAPAPPTSRAGRAQLVAVVARGLETVVAVGEHDRRAADERRRSRAMRSRRRRSRPARGCMPSASVQVASTVSGSSSSVRPAAEAQAPDRVDVDARSRGAARAGPTWPWRRCARGAARLGSPGFGQRERADDAPGVARLAVRVAELHAVGVEARCGVVRRARPMPPRPRGPRPLVRSGRRRPPSSRGRISRTALCGAAASSAPRCSSSITS